MNLNTIIFFLVLLVLLLAAVILYQRIAFHRGVQGQLRRITASLTAILDADSDEHVMIFTGNKALIDLDAQINRLLDERQKIKADYRRTEISSKKMLSNISHDIKTPLTVILGYLEIMRLNREDDEMLKKIEAKAKQVMDMITQFFTLAKLEAGDMDMELSRIKINEVCRESILDFYQILSQKGTEADVCIPEEAIYVLGNADAMHRILYNLLSNAVRYGLDGNFLGLCLRADRQYAYIDIIDKGKGISREFASSVFDRLYTMEDSRNRDIQGNGLGLTIARSLAQQQGGSLTLESEPSVKTIFTVRLNRILYETASNGKESAPERNS